MLFTAFFMVSFFAQGQTMIKSKAEIDNGTIHLKLDLTRGGAISYLSLSGKDRNIVVGSLDEIRNTIYRLHSEKLTK